MKVSIKFAVVGFVAIFLTLSGCAKLEKGGAYAPVVNNVQMAPDVAFYTVDASFDVAYAAMDEVFSFEKRNRLVLWKVSPNIKHALDRIRPQAKAIVKQYAVVRQAYLQMPTPEGLSELRTLLGRFKQVSDAVQAIIPNQGKE